MSPCMTNSNIFIYTIMPTLTLKIRASEEKEDWQVKQIESKKEGKKKLVDCFHIQDRNLQSAITHQKTHHNKNHYHYSRQPKIYFWVLMIC